MPHNDENAGGVGSSKGGVVDIVANMGRSHMLMVRGSAWTILSGGISACHGLKLDKEDDIKVGVLQMC